MVDLDTARAAKQHLIERIGGWPQVNGVGLTRRQGQYALKVGLVEELDGDLPSEVDGVEVVAEVVGRVRPLDGDR